MEIVIIYNIYLVTPPRNEKIEVIYGMDKIINITLNRFSLTKYKITTDNYDNRTNCKRNN